MPERTGTVITWPTRITSLRSWLADAAGVGLSFLVGLSLAALAPLSHAGVPIDTIGGSEISFEGMIQADGYWYDNDLANLDGDPLTPPHKICEAVNDEVVVLAVRLA